MTNLRPIMDNIIVERLPPEDTSPGGIYMAAQSLNRWATVHAVGPGAVTKSGARVEPRIKVGDVVLLDARHHNERQEDGWRDTVTWNGRRCQIVREGDLLAVRE